jgi:hypothetical protein
VVDDPDLLSRFTTDISRLVLPASKSQQADVSRLNHFQEERLMKRVVLLSFALFAATSVFAQSLPVKSGLWENVVYDDDGKPMLTALNCFTSSSFADMLSSANKHPGCKVTSQNTGSKGMTVDMSCDRPKVQMTSHGVLEVVDSEHVRSTTTVKMTVDGQTKVSTHKAAASFKKPSCGDVKPGDPKITSE